MEQREIYCNSKGKKRYRDIFVIASANDIFPYRILFCTKAVTVNKMNFTLFFYSFRKMIQHFLTHKPLSHQLAQSRLHPFYRGILCGKIVHETDIYTQMQIEKKYPIGIGNMPFYEYRENDRICEG